MIQLETSNNIALITLDSPPVNALGLPMREALAKYLQQAFDDDTVKAIVITSNLALFCGGADIEEFDTDVLWARPNLHDLIDTIENGPKLIIAAINGIVMGGGLELALGCDYRIVRQSAKLGLPEIKLGLFPGAGGTQRLPRIAGLQTATDMILSGNPISGDVAAACGLADRVAANDFDFVAQALSYAEELIVTNAARRNCAEIEVDLSQVGSDFFNQTRTAIAAKSYGQIAPEYCLKSIELSTQRPLVEALEIDTVSFKELLDTPQARAMIHLFFAEREANKIPGLAVDKKGRDSATRNITSVGVIGAGTMGSGIAIACLDGGFPVTLLDSSQEALDRGLNYIAKHYQRSVEKGRIKHDKAERLKAAVTGTLDYDALADADLVIEAVFEDLVIKKAVFEQLDKVCKSGAILASNTSTLDLNEIARTTSRASDVIGLHFFSPANIMRLLEVVRGDASSVEVINTTLHFARRIRKVPVVVGVCFGFVGNRMLEPYFREGSRLLLEGASPEQVDQALTDFGMAMGIISVADLAGIDVSYRVRESRRQEFAQDPSYQAIQDKLYQLGRYGQKTGHGSYFYQGREKTSDPEVITLCEQLASELGIDRREISDQEVLERCLYPLINEGIQILDEGVAYRPGDIDLIWVNGYGFPAWRGGPLWYADETGLDQVLTGMNRYRDSLGDYGEMWFKPAPLLEQLVSQGGKLGDIKKTES
jgi:3-hydroxyacyl-CoA dehydrogenase